MPSIKLSFQNVTLRDDFRDHLEAVLGEYGPVTWLDWSVTNGDRITYNQPTDGDLLVPPPRAYFDGSTEASFTVAAKQKSDSGAREWVVDFFAHQGSGWLTVIADDDDLRRLTIDIGERLAEYEVPEEADPVRPFKVFIAYGGGPAWEVVRDYLRRADIEIDAFTESERVGEVTIDVVSKMIRSASVAVIVMTAAHQLRDESWHARQNVIHEAGFAQGVLGVRNTIILLEEGVELPSNLGSVTYIPFPRGAVHTTEQRVVDRIRETKADLERG